MEEIRKGIKVLKEGGIVIFPTDTAFGIGCRIDDEKAIERLFEIRKRPRIQATPVLVDMLEMAQEYLLPIPRNVIDKLIKPYWPGALTIILQSRIDKVPELVRGGKEALGVRMPDHSIALALIKGIGVPILGPSANFHGEKTPYRFEDLDGKLIKLVDYVVLGECTLRQQSTVIDCSEKPWRIIRQGAVKVQSAKLKNIIKLIIDTSSNKEIKVGLRTDTKEYVIKETVRHHKAQVVLPLIDKLLYRQKLKITDINSIDVNVGHESFTGIRVGMSIANALSFALGIPIRDPSTPPSDDGLAQDEGRTIFPPSFDLKQ